MFAYRYSRCAGKMQKDVSDKRPADGIVDYLQ